MSKRTDFKVPTTFNPEMLVWGRLNEGWSIDEAATAIGIPADELLRYERGEDLPYWSTIEKIAKAYRRPTALFLRTTTPKDPRRHLVRVVHHYSDGTQEVFHEEGPNQE